MQYLKERTRFLNRLDFVNKAIFLLGDSTGLTKEEMISLEYGDFIESISDYIVDKPVCPCVINELYDHMRTLDYLVGEWYITNPRTGKKLYVFNSSESTLAILDYLKYDRKAYVSLKEPLFEFRNDNILSQNHILRILNEIGQGDTE